MSDGGPPPGMSFPQKVHTEDEDFVIELDENHMAGSHDSYGMDDRSRCKRRKRCGQCGPCQVKENCMKCHFCIRKDVLKQTCIYRKCVYLRSKPKPYSRPHQSPQGRVSPPRDMVQSPPGVRSPPNAQTHPGMPFPDTGIHMPEPRPENHPFFPAQLPQQSTVTAQQNNGYVSPPNPMMDNRTPSLPNHTAGSSMNMQMSASPHVPNNAISPPVQKMQDATSPVAPQPVNSPMAAIPGIPTPVSSCSSITPHIPSMPHMGSHVPPVFSPPSMSSGSLTNIPTIPTLPSVPGIGERTVNEFRPPDQFQLTPHHPHPHYPPVHPHPHMPPRDTGLFGDPSRVPHMNFNTSNHMDSLARGPNDSSCMYHPGLPYSVPGHYQPSGHSFIPGAAEMNPFRSNFLNSFPPGYSYPPDRYRDGFGSLPFSRLGMSSSATFPQYPGQGHGYGMGNSFSQQYYNSQHGCPKNGSRPPVSPSTDDVKVLQAGYKINENIPKSKVSEMGSPNSKVSDLCSPKSGVEENIRERRNSGRMSSDIHPAFSDVIHQRSRSSLCDLSPRMDHLRAWSEFYLNKTFGRPDIFPPHSSKPQGKNENVLPQNLRSPLWEPWKMPPWYSPRRDDVRSRASTSTLSSDFECEVISIDDHQMNALIRSDGCNSIEIEFDNSSLCSNEDSPRKHLSTNSRMSDFASPMKNNFFQPIEKLLISEPRSLMSPWQDDSPAVSESGGNSLCNESLNKISKQTVKGDTIEKTSSPKLGKRSKMFIKGSVCIRQELGDEGTMQLELPGHKVTVEDTVLGEEMLKECSNVEELKEFIKSNHSVQVNKLTDTDFV
ncbi:cuticle collagen bli-1-like [Mercenaria mercenaria]|uniref:cuticle collagen bli-1-like n=1 Tax=Mercenaria mercenaria TaxID=6596 RepID=UPI00234F0DD5|nr:cuticle collagen bli-1-like [Mercenaria mercenaria]